MVFSPEEETWLASHLSQLVDINNPKNAKAKAKATRSAFLRSLHTEFLKEFPLRHPRLVDHVPHSQEDEAQTLYGSDLWRMSEQLRNKLNSISHDVRVKKIKHPPPPKALLPLEDTVESLKERLKGQGIIDVGLPTPCGPSASVDFLTRRAGSRLQMYSGPDYASVTDYERDCALADLPGDLHELVTVLSAHTGAEIYMLASWRDANDEQLWTDAISPYSEIWARSQDIVLTRKSFVSFQLMHNYIRYGPHIEQAGPVVYWACDGSLRPWMPRVAQAPVEYLRQLLEMYFPLFYTWQGGVGELDYACPDLVMRERMPKDVPQLLHPNQWTPQIIPTLYGHVLASQAGVLGDDFRFQFAQLGSHTSNETCYDIHPESTLQYPASSRYFFARLQLRNDDDPHMRQEYQNMLPMLPAEDNAYEPYLGEDTTRMGEYAGEYETMLNLIHAVAAYEECGPIHAQPGHWRRVQQECIWFKHVKIDADNCLQALRGPHADESFFHPRAVEKDARSLVTFSSWLRSGVLTHELTGTAFAGRWGLRWPVTQLFLFWYSIRALHEGEEMLYTSSIARVKTIREWDTKLPKQNPVAIVQATPHIIPGPIDSDESEEDDDSQEELLEEELAPGQVRKGKSTSIARTSAIEGISGAKTPGSGPLKSALKHPKSRSTPKNRTSRSIQPRQSSVLPESEDEELSHPSRRSLSPLDEELENSGAQTEMEINVSKAPKGDAFENLSSSLELPPVSSGQSPTPGSARREFLPVAPGSDSPEREPSAKKRPRFADMP